jgi:hypothetical protein
MMGAGAAGPITVKAPSTFDGRNWRHRRASSGSPFVTRAHGCAYYTPSDCCTNFD